MEIWPTFTKYSIRVILVISIFFNLSYNKLNAQNLKKEDLIGIWQYGSSEINSGWFDNYQFFNNGSFVFNTNQNDGLKRVINIGGTFSLKSDTLFLYINFSKELLGCSGWVIENGTVKTIM
jgi:hypothetical protein